MSKTGKSIGNPKQEKYEKVVLEHIALIFVFFGKVCEHNIFIYFNVFNLKGFRRFFIFSYIKENGNEKRAEWTPKRAQFNMRIL